MWFLYVVRCVDGSLYVGISSDVVARVARHNAGKGAEFTKNKRPVVAVYCEQFANKSDAFRREREVKKFSKANKEYLIKFGTGMRFPSPPEVSTSASGLAPRRKS